MLMLIGIHGKPHSGKDTIANYLINEYGFLKFGPSNPVKVTAAAMFNVPIECFYDENLKETVDPFWGITYREMAQKVGKESSRDVFGEDFWMRHVGLRLKELEDENDVHLRHKEHHQIRNGIVLADIRYPNEATWVKRFGGSVIFVDRDDVDRGFVANEQHPAERGLPLELADYVIDNRATKDALFYRVEKVMTEIKAQYLISCYSASKKGNVSCQT